MNIPHDKFCVLPWISLEASPIGTVRPCCLSLSEVIDDNGIKISAGETALVDIQSTRHMRDLRKSFLEGHAPSDCQRCWDEEQAGRTSKRQHTLNRLQHVVPDREWTTEAGPLMFLDLKLGNICNLKCRICGSWSSSTFAAEEIRYQSDKKHNFHYAMMTMGRWPRERQEFWQDLQQHFSEILYIEFTGGEPFMIQEHFDLLQGFVNRNIAHNVEIHYNTNGTQRPEQAETLWQQFKTVEIAFSIDDLHERFEYQRSNAVWYEVIENLAWFQGLRSRHRNIKLQVCSTVNIFNVLHLESLAKWIDIQAFDFIYWNVLHEARPFCISSLPESAKKLVADKLDAATVRDFHRQEFDKIKAFMMAGESMPAETINEQIRRLDQRRGQHLKNVIRELADALDYEKN